LTQALPTQKATFILPKAQNKKRLVARVKQKAIRTNSVRKALTQLLKTSKNQILLGTQIARFANVFVILFKNLLRIF
jgi:hypothetical protein